MVALRCPGEQGRELWGELWWAGGQYRWVFFDEHKTGVTYSEQVAYCPECGGQLEQLAAPGTASRPPYTLADCVGTYNTGGPPSL